MAQSQDSGEEMGELVVTRVQEDMAITSTVGKGKAITTTQVEGDLSEGLSMLEMVTRNKTEGDRAQNKREVGENKGIQGRNPARDNNILAETLLPILQKEEINLEAQGTQYWLGALYLMGKEELRQQNIMTCLREGLEDREEFKIKLVSELEENESTMEVLLRKLMKEEESMAEWRIIRGQAQKQLEQEEANEICSSILADVMVGMFSTIQALPVDQKTRSDPITFASKDVREKTKGQAGVDNLPPKGDHKDPTVKLGEQEGLPRQEIKDMSTAGKTEDQTVRQGEPLALGLKVSVMPQIPFMTGLEAKTYMDSLEHEVVLMQEKGEDMYQAAINLGEEGLARASCTNWGTSRLWMMAKSKWSRTVLHVMAAMSFLGWSWSW
jgi:hypothetical protein